MRKINNKNINGNLYIENFDEREEEDRVKIYDSDENYLDYLPIEEDETPIEEQYNNYIEMLEQFKTVKELLDWLGTFYGLRWANRIGDVHIVISD